MTERPFARLHRRWFFAAVVLAALTATVAVAAAQQTRHEGRTILDIIFGRQPQPQHTAPKRAQPRPRRARPHRHTAPKKAPAATGPAPVAKIDNARDILVVGDFMAGGLADGLQEAFADSPGVAIVDRTNGSSGLVRDDYYDWPARIDPILDEVKPAIAVVLIGSNDRQAMRIDGHAEPVRSDAWTAEYTKRATAIAQAVTKRHIPLLWAAVPPFRSSSMSADILAFDGIFRSVVAKVGGQFVDTWDGFADKNGDFVYTGPDINGQPVRLRGPDGINLTAAGKRKLAFYVEKPARRLLGSAADTDIATLKDENLPPLMALPANLPTRIVRTDPIGLTDPALDGDKTLLGGGDRRDTASNDTDTPRAKLVEDGEVATAPAGRADNFGWPRADGQNGPTDDRHDAAGRSTGSEAIVRPNPMQAADGGPH